MACNSDIRSRRISRYRSNLLQIRIITPSEDSGPLLGFLVTQRRGPSHRNLKVQYISATLATGCNYRTTRSRAGSGHDAPEHHKWQPGHWRLHDRFADPHRWYDRVERGDIPVHPRRCEDPGDKQSGTQEENPGEWETNNWCKLPVLRRACRLAGELTPDAKGTPESGNTFVPSIQAPMGSLTEIQR